LKKIVALIISIALLFSMYSGVTFAQSIYVVLADNEIVHDGSSDLIRIRGTLVDSNNYSYSDSTTIGLYNSSDQLVKTTTNEQGSSSFSISVLGNMLEVGTYYVRPTGGSNDPENRNRLRVIPEISLGSGSTINYTHPLNDDVYINGFFPNEDGDEYDVTFGYVSTNGNMMTSLGTVVAKEKTFAILVDRSDMNRTGKIGIFADGVLAVEGEIAASELDVTMNPKSVVHTLEGTQPLTFTFNFPSYNSDGSIFRNSDNQLKSNYKINISIENTNEELSDIDYDLVTYSKDFNDEDNQKAVYNINAEDWDSGTTDVVVKLIDTSTNSTVQQKSVSLKVTRPDSYTLIGWDLESKPAGSIKFALPDVRYTTSDNANYPEGSTADQKIQVKNRDSYDMRYFEVEAKGVGVDKIFRNFGTNAVTSATINPVRTGSLSLSIKVYESETSSSPVRVYNKTVDITGFNVDIDPNEIPVDSTRDVTIEITDENGNPINNAIVRFNDTTVVSSYSENILNGRYIYEDDDKNFFTSVGNLDIEVVGFHRGEELVIELEDAITVVGKEVYEVTSSVDSLVNGIEEDIYITTWDGSNKISPERIEFIYVDKEGNRSAPDRYTGSRRYSDGAVEVAIKANEDYSYILVRTSTDSGKKMGEVRIDVTGPEVKMFDADSATENIKSKIRFTVLDPRDNEPMDRYVYLLADETYIDYTAKFDGDSLNVSDGKSSSRRPDIDDEYIFEVLVDDVDWDKAEENEQELYISLYAEEDGDDIKLLEIPIKNAQITTDPSEIIVGAPATQIELKYLDGDGNPLSGYEILVNDEEIGETDEDGTIYFSTASSLGMAITVKAETDDSKEEGTDDNEDTIYTVHRISPVADTKPPVASAPATVNSSSVLVKIRDEGRVQLARINGTPVDIFFPVVEVDHFVTNLKKGDNKIVVEAADASGNYSNTELTVTYTTETSPGPGRVQLTIGKATQYGVPELTNGTTMVPARFVEQLGVTFEYDPQTKTATYKYGDHTVSVTDNDSYGMVNGQEVVMSEPAYINDQARFMVPVRMVGQELGFTVNWVAMDQPITITK